MTLTKRETVVKALRSNVAIAAIIVLAAGFPAHAQDVEPDHIRGQIVENAGSSIVVKMRDGETVRLATSEDLTIISLEKGSFTKVEFGSYVGAVAVKLEEFSPIVRDAVSFLHKGHELRIIDEELRGIAAGEKKWSLPPGAIAAHGWVDDMEDRILSIKYGPTEKEETDVEVPRDVPVLNMALADDRSLIKEGAHIFAGALKDEDGNYVAVFIFVGKDGIVPAL
jgi:hypothetical protein